MFQSLFKKKKENRLKEEGNMDKKETAIAEITYKKKEHQLSNVSEEEIAKAIKSLLSKDER
ncbi:hypothetical protein [Marinisporobacter balticus]|uniref:Uncharacterized protein n=1 Tax=Marinisporobacter balticus TaxID=2018667 RepID=A0A4R2KR85_9FIRM|nr:hypothetical protein [Marinisporobacter balticus]TCO75237.1 hypothetical protein EV214_10974 [Marinisporobacter balticus]